jgi:hypothetical protein
MRGRWVKLGPDSILATPIELSQTSVASIVCSLSTPNVGDHVIPPVKGCAIT